jgi:hypothetical protein
MSCSTSAATTKRPRPLSGANGFPTPSATVSVSLDPVDINLGVFWRCVGSRGDADLVGVERKVGLVGVGGFGVGGLRLSSFGLGRVVL